MNTGTMSVDVKCFLQHILEKKKKPLFSGDFLPHILKNKIKFGSLKKKKFFPLGWERKRRHPAGSTKAAIF